MEIIDSKLPGEFYSHFKVFHELMANKVKEILLVASPYDAFILEEDGSLASRIINEYSGLNLSQPPRVTRTSSAYDALSLLSRKSFDIVLTMPHLDKMDAFSLGLEIKKVNPDLPVIILTHSVRDIYPLPEDKNCNGIDKIFVWSGNSDLLLALVKNVEDRLNIDNDTQKAGVRVLVLVEDSPIYYSFFLPIIYKEIVQQTQAVLEVGLNEDHRLLTMRARPKILFAEDYDEALALCRKYRSFLFGIISDTRIPRQGKLDPTAGIKLLRQMKEDVPDLPLLLMSSEPENRQRAENIPAIFLNKNSRQLHSEIHDFFISHLGFGDFVFRNPEGKEIDRAHDLRSLEEKVAQLPDDSLWHHARRNHFSNWIMGRAEITLASTFREVKASQFSNSEEMRKYIISNIHTLRKLRQKGVVARFNPQDYDPDVIDFVKVGNGSLGGKARGLAFMSALMQQNSSIYEKFPKTDIEIPKTLVLTTQGFEDFVDTNDLKYLARDGFNDKTVKKAFLNAKMPDWIIKELEAYLKHVTYPLSVRSSSLLEDAQYRPYAGLYETYMIPNNQKNPTIRLRHLIKAIKLVYASTYYEGPKAYTKNNMGQPSEESMAVVIQKLAGQKYGDYFYPAISGVAQSHNYYPLAPMKPEEGIVHIALGMGKTVVEGEKALRFSPKYPKNLPQFSTVDDILDNAQRSFYALQVTNYPEDLNFDSHHNLVKRNVDDADEDFPVRMLASTYVPEEHRVRDSGYLKGPKILTFANVLKYDTMPLSQLLNDLLELGRKGMGTPIEIEFSVDLDPDDTQSGVFSFLQMRPMVAEEIRSEVIITAEEVDQALCRSYQVLGNGKYDNLADIVYVQPDTFKASATVQIADEIDTINAQLSKAGRRYLLIGPGRWGSADRWLGIPVRWLSISGAGAIIEIRNERLRADASQGSHFFQNITSQGIPYLTVTEGARDFINWQWVDSLPIVQQTEYVRHVRLEKSMDLKIDGKNSVGVILPQ